MENEHFTTLKLLYVFIKSVSFLQAKEWTILTNERPLYKPQDQSEGLLHAAVASKPSSEQCQSVWRHLTHFLSSRAAGGRCSALPSDMGCYNWVFVPAPNIGSLELVKARIKKNVNNFNKCKDPFSNDVLGQNSFKVRQSRQIKYKWTTWQIKITRRAKDICYQSLDLDCYNLGVYQINESTDGRHNI